MKGIKISQLLNVNLNNIVIMIAVDNSITAYWAKGNEERAIIFSFCFNYQKFYKNWNCFSEMHRLKTFMG